jgi:lactoylglutathione lyase
VTAFVVALTSAALLAQKPPPQSRILGSRNRTGINRKRQVNLFDPDGTRVELMEPDTIDGRPVPSSTLPPPR